MYKILKPFEKGMFTTLTETFKDITNYEGQYQIGDQGNVKSLARYPKGRRSPLPEKLLAVKMSKSGYPTLGLCRDGKKTFFTIHRLVAQHFIENPEDKPTVNHKDSVKTNNCATNLEWSTHQEQMHHAVANNLLEVRGTPKYSPEMKQQLKEEYLLTSVSIAALSRKYKISERTISRVVDGEIEPKTKLSRDEVKSIIVLRNEGKTLKSIADKFNCGISQVHRITRGESRNNKYERDNL
jgi:Mor family transcriptional regulator